MEPVNKSPDTVIVSAFGRGFWLATELARRGWSMTFVDVTDAMGPWKPEDWEGPWGFFETPELASSQLAHLANRDATASVPDGFAIGMPQGPLELRSPLTSFQLQSFGVPEVVRHYLEPLDIVTSEPEPISTPASGVAAPGAVVDVPRKKHGGAEDVGVSGKKKRKKNATEDVETTASAAEDKAAGDTEANDEADGFASGIARARAVAGAASGMAAGFASEARIWMETAWLASLGLGVKKPSPLKGRERLNRQVQGLPFSESWLGHLSHTVASNVYAENNEAASQGRPFIETAPYAVRYQTRETHEQGLKELEALGVRVIRSARVEDVRVNGRVLDAIEISAEHRGVERGRSFVWTLSSFETARFPESVGSALFPEGNIVPEWAWIRFRVGMNANSASRTLPAAFVTIENLYLPWTHANLAHWKRVQESEGREGILRFDIWLRVPARSLRDSAYIESLGRELTANIARRIPLSEPVCETWPAELQVLKKKSETKDESRSEKKRESKTGHEMAGEPESSEKPLLIRFGVYDVKALAGLKLRNSKNIFFDGPEQWNGLDWTSQLTYQRAVFAAMERLKAIWIAAERRQEIQT